MRRGTSGAHAHDERRILIGARELVYRLSRTGRRTLALHVDAAGVRVSVPLSTRDEEVERFVVGHGDWLLDRLRRHEARIGRNRVWIEDGAMVPLLGQHVRLRLQPGRRRPRWASAADGVEELTLGALGDPLSALERCLKARALNWFSGRVEEFCLRLGTVPPRVSLTSARTRWGSCSATSGIRLHWRLIHLPARLGDYVVAHEVAHLRHMDHSSRFWATVETLYPDWRQARQALRAASSGLPELGCRPGGLPSHAI